jgi:hypothetical protein
MRGRHRDFLPIALGTFALVTGYGLANDQWIAAIAPEHYAIFYPHYFPFAQAWAQALCFALVGTGVPGLAWGILLYWAGHYGPGPMVGRRATLLGVAAVVLLTSIAAWGLGWRVAVSSKHLYPAYFYPTDNYEIGVTQTVQLTNYIAGLAGAWLWLLIIYVWRLVHAMREEPAQ